MSFREFRKLNKILNSLFYILFSIFSNISSFCFWASNCAIGRLPSWLISVVFVTLSPARSGEHIIMVLCCCGNNNDQVDDPEDGPGGPEVGEGGETRGLFISQIFVLHFIGKTFIFPLFLQRGAPVILLTKCSTAGLEEWTNSNMEVSIFILFSIYSLDVCHNLPCC